MKRAAPIALAAVCAGFLVPAAETVIIANPEMAGISGFREYWNRPVVVAADGAVRMSDRGRFGKGDVADWSTEKPGAPVFDAVHRSLLVRFPEAAEKVAEKLRAGAEIEKVDRYATAFGPAEVSHAVPEGRMDISALLAEPAFGKKMETRLRRFADCGLTLRKWELYDAKYWKGGYEWGVATGQRGIMIGSPRLEITFREGNASELPELKPIDLTRLPSRGQPTAVLPGENEFADLAKQFAFRRPAGATNWQWARMQELHAMGGGKGFPETYEEYLKWVDGMLSLHPRAWKGFSAGEMAAEYAMYQSAIPEPAKENLRRYWWAWLMPDRPFNSLVQGYIGGKEARAYYERTGDWRGNFSVYRTYCHAMGTVNFNSWATTGAMFGGWIIGDEGVMQEAREGYDHWMTRTWTWLDGTSQESIDHYYFAHTLGPLKTIADFAPGPEERLAGRINVEKHVDELIACWHPRPGQSRHRP